MLYTFVRNFKIISRTVFNLLEWTRVHGRNGYVQCSKDNNSKSMQTRVTVHVFYTWSHSALHLCREITSDGIRVMYGADTNDGSADGRTHTQNFGGYNIIPSPRFVAGHKNGV